MKFNYLPPLLLFAIACVLFYAQQDQLQQQPSSTSTMTPTASPSPRPALPPVTTSSPQKPVAPQHSPSSSTLNHQQTSPSPSLSSKQQKTPSIPTPSTSQPQTGIHRKPSPSPPPTPVVTQAPKQQQQPASKRFIEGNIPLAEIFAEWDTKSLNGPHYICICTQKECDTRPSWPQRSFAEGEAIPVLGEFNRNRKRQMGFTQCSRR